jgi:hypothetical protein
VARTTGDLETVMCDCKVRTEYGVSVPTYVVGRGTRKPQIQPIRGRSMDADGGSMASRANGETSIQSPWSSTSILG